MLNLISDPTRQYTTETIGHHIIESLKTNTRDVPLALLYQVDNEAPPGECWLNLRGSIGVPPNHPLHLQQATLTSEEGIIPLLRRAETDVVTVAPGPEFEGIKWEGYREPSKYISAVSLTNAGRLLGFLVVGTNPQRPIDEDHEQLVRDLARQLSSTIAFHVSTEEATKRQQRLINQLADSERQIRYMASTTKISSANLY
jgi:hypothetical protein